MSTRYISLRAMSFTGTLPTQFGTMSQMTALAVDSNELTGTIPTQLGRATELLSVVLASNALTGAVPTELGHLVEITRAELISNMLCDDLPSEVSMLASSNLLQLSWDNTYVGTPCCEASPEVYTCAPTHVPTTSVPSFSPTAGPTLVPTTSLPTAMPTAAIPSLNAITAFFFNETCLLEAYPDTQIGLTHVKDFMETFLAELRVESVMVTTIQYFCLVVRASQTTATCNRPPLVTHQPSPPFITSTAPLFEDPLKDPFKDGSL